MSEVFDRVRKGFEEQPFMKTLGASLVGAKKGEVEILLPNRAALHQHRGFIHAAALTAVLDNACGFAALTTAAPTADVLTIEFKVNFLSPALAPEFLAIGRVVRAGKQICVTQGEISGLGANGERKICALMTATMFLAPKP